MAGLRGLPCAWLQKGEGMTRKARVRSVAVLGAVLTIFALFPALAATANTPLPHAAFTTTNTSLDGTGHCKNGNEAVNCNIYDGKQYVWLNGGPVEGQLDDGTYFFAVLEPGGQGGNENPNDGTPNNLSDLSPTTNTGAGDAWTNRVFSISNHVLTYPATGYPGGHDFDSNKIRLMPYDDTPNPGGVYIMAICSLADATDLDSQGSNPPGVDASDCKYDAFKVQTGEVTEGFGPEITKDADGAYDNTYAWTITKSADKTLVEQTGGSVTFTYTITVTHDGGTISNVTVTGQIQVFNPNADGNGNTVPLDITSVTDALSDGTVCSVTGGGAQTLTAFETDFAYTCALNGLPQGELDNVATVTWPDQTLDNGNHVTGGSADFTFSSISFDENAIDECVSVSDSYAGSLGTACVGDANPKTFTYTRTIPVVAGCVSYDNTATFTTNDTGTTGSASQTVTVCGPVKTGALTIGFWKTTNGQNLIKQYCQNPALANYLKGLGGGSGPFSNAPTTTCTALATYVQGVLNGASATNMNNMLRAQMMGTALDVWFSGPGWTSTKTGGIKPPSNFLQHNNLGTFNMDLTAVCPMVDNTTTGTATCKNNTPSTDAFASGAVPATPMSMQAILDFAATTPSPFNGSTSAPVWYGGDRTKQEILKNIFDQFNNQLAFGSF